MTTIIKRTSEPGKSSGRFTNVNFVAGHVKTNVQVKESLFYRLMLLANRSNDWSYLSAASVLLAAALAAGYLWQISTGQANGIFLTPVLLAFVTIDAAILWSLPRLKVSFGPIVPQLLLLSAGRLCLILLALVAARLVVGAEIGFWLAVSLNVAASLAFVWGSLIEPSRLQLTQISLQTGKLAPGSRPLRLMQISDLHVERLGRREAQLLQIVEEAQPDVILLTGDYLNLSFLNDAEARSETRHLLARLCDLQQKRANAPSPAIYAILGTPVVDAEAYPLLQGLPIGLLRDREELLEVYGSSLTLVGLECHHDSVRDGQQLIDVSSRVRADSLAILLYHSPELMRIAPACHIDLYLCGHTHGGQIRLPGYGAVLTSSSLGKQYEMGLYTVGDTHLYVNRGVGFEGLSAPRIRFLSPPEVTLFELSPVSAEPIPADRPER